MLPMRRPGEKLQRRVKNATAAELSLTKSRANDMTTIHDNDPGSPMRELERSLLRTQFERDALAQRMDELESVLAAGRLGYCRICAARARAEANSQFKAEFGLASGCGQSPGGSWLERIQRDDRTKASRMPSKRRSAPTPKSISVVRTQVQGTRRGNGLRFAAAPSEVTMARCQPICW